MPKLIYALSVSLDGYVEGPNGDLSWSVPDAALHQHFNDRERNTGTALYGRRLYETMTAFWPTADEDPSAPKEVKEYARIWRSKPKVVFSTTLKEAGWGFRLVSGNVEAEVKKLKAQPGGDLLVGGPGLAASLMRLGLIDEYHLYLHPVLLGGGKPMFPPLPKQINLQFVERRQFGGGVVMLRYEHAAP